MTLGEVGWNFAAILAHIMKPAFLTNVVSVLECVAEEYMQ